MSENDETVNEDLKTNDKCYQFQIVWRNVVLIPLVHLAALYGVYCGFIDCQYKTCFFAQAVGLCSGFGVLCGAHRLWCHRSYKAKLPLQIILAIFQTVALETDIYEWSRDHRVHHRFSETDADPHNAKRGFFFAHVGWLLCKKHPDVSEKGKTVDMSDLEIDPLVNFQRKFYLPLVILFWGVIPTIIPYYFWNENLSSSIFVCVFLRWVILLNITWSVNSAAHLWGIKPYDKNINPVECVIRHVMLGEGFHNYHHTFPWDYSASEYGPSEVYNLATAFIDLFAKIGWAYDLKKVSRQTVERKMIKSGDITFTKQSPFKELLFGFLSSFSYFILPLSIKFIYEFNFR